MLDYQQRTFIQTKSIDKASDPVCRMNGPNSSIPSLLSSFIKLSVLLDPTGLCNWHLAAEQQAQRLQTNTTLKISSHNTERYNFVW